jgi:hypothetical protein
MDQQESGVPKWIWVIVIIISIIAIGLVLLVTLTPVTEDASSSSTPKQWSCPDGYPSVNITYQGDKPYCFYQGKDSSRGDIAQKPFAEAVAACNADQTCIGLNTNGWYKQTVTPYSEWKTWSDDPAEGFYMKAI